MTKHETETPIWPAMNATQGFHSHREAASALKMSNGRLTKILDGHGLLTTTQADRAASALDVHPTDIWTNWADIDTATVFNLDDLRYEINSETDPDAVWAVVAKFVTEGVALIDANPQAA